MNITFLIWMLRWKERPYKGQLIETDIDIKEKIMN